MVTINIFPPPDASQKHTEQNSTVSGAPEPAAITSTESVTAAYNQPSPSMQVQALTAGHDAAPAPVAQFSSFQEQGFANTDAPVPSMDFLNLNGDFQSAPDPALNPGNAQSAHAAIPFPSLLPPGENTEMAEKSLTKKK